MSLLQWIMVGKHGAHSIVAILRETQLHDVVCGSRIAITNVKMQLLIVGRREHGSPTSTDQTCSQENGYREEHVHRCYKICEQMLPKLWFHRLTVVTPIQKFITG